MGEVSKGAAAAGASASKSPAGADAGAAERLLQLTGVTKSFGPVRANRDITLHVDRGEIVALLGENGAGKSTLVKQIFGLISPDSGSIVVKGDERAIRDPKDAIRRGIGMVHQHFQLVPVMTVAENIILGNEPGSPLRVDRASARTMVRELSDRYGLGVDPDTAVEDLAVGTQQRVEILKALSRRVDLLILDEPTAVLTPQETDELLRVMRELAAGGTSIVFITHKLREVLAVADRVYALRHGEVVGEVRAADTDEAELARLMVGRSVVLRVDKPPASPGPVVLRVEDLAVRDDRRLPAVRGLTLSVRAGEIVGLAGVEGNGQRELVEAIAGMRSVDGGSIHLDAVGSAPVNLTRAPARKVRSRGVSHIPEDREKHGLVGTYSIADNLVLNCVDEAPFARSGIRRRDAIASHAGRLVDEYDIRAAGIESTASSLSGGNKQKVVVARELDAKPRLLLAAQPTRGVDVGSIEFIHRQIVAARDDGMAVLLVSAELDEVLALADRVAVIHDGQVVAEMPAEAADRQEIGRLMAGGHG
ncbi:MAG: ABC transporter ATP-binding protein [Actinomycetales bacterium]